MNNLCSDEGISALQSDQAQKDREMIRQLVFAAKERVPNSLESAVKALELQLEDIAGLRDHIERIVPRQLCSLPKKDMERVHSFLSTEYSIRLLRASGGNGTHRKV